MYKLLIVDDEAKIREVIKEYAEFSGYEVTEAEDGMSAIGLCKLNAVYFFRLQTVCPTAIFNFPFSTFNFKKTFALA